MGQHGTDEQLSSAFGGVRWFTSKDELLNDGNIVGVVCEGANDESLGQAAEIVAAGKHCWLDKPAGEDWAEWQRIVADAQRQVAAAAPHLDSDTACTNRGRV
jgi:predicted dehydrogenase